LRAGINFGNVLLAAKDGSTGAARGIAVDLAEALGARLDLPVEIVAYDAAGRMADASASGAWDVAFLALDPERANSIAFSAGYLEVEATYLVPQGSRIETLADVDREGVRVAVTDKSAYDLFLTRTLARAQLVRAPTTDESFDVFVERKLEALAGLRPRLELDAERIEGSRVLDGRFSAIQQAIGTPKGRGATARFVREFVEQAKSSGLVADSIDRHGIRGVSVAAPQAIE
jgi:polar amino acid transport system substrate-binding protein